VQLSLINVQVPTTTECCRVQLITATRGKASEAGAFEQGGEAENATNRNYKNENAMNHLYNCDENARTSRTAPTVIRCSVKRHHNDDLGNVIRHKSTHLNQPTHMQ